MKFLATLFLAFSLMRTAEGSPAVNVIIAQGTAITIGSPSDFTLAETKTAAGDYIVTNSNGSIQVGDRTFAARVAVLPGSPLFHLTVNGKPYRGMLFIKAADSQLKVVNQVPLEEYLYGVVAKEMPGTDLEALKAQAIASRTLAVEALIHKHVMRATQTEEVYGGVEAEREASNQAVDNTQGIILMYQGKPLASPLFSSTCGGKTENSADVFGKPLPYLQSVSDTDENQRPFCQFSPYVSWTVSWNADDLEKIFASQGVTGNLIDLIRTEIDSAGHVKELLIKTTEGEWKFRGNAIRNALLLPDGKPLYSTWFEISKSLQNGHTLFTATGHGKGHGVGLCQWGAIGMARKGKTFQEILTHYYKMSEIRSSLLEAYEQMSNKRSRKKTRHSQIRS